MTFLNTCGQSLAVLFIFVPISLSWAETNYPLTVQDGLGTEVVFHEPPSSVSSLTLFSDELLLELLPVEQISSMTFLANDPVYSNIAAKIPASVSLLDLNVEALVGMYPDLVIAANWSEAAKISQLRNAGIPVYLINTPVTLEQVVDEIRILAACIG